MFEGKNLEHCKIARLIHAGARRLRNAVRRADASLREVRVATAEPIRAKNA
jgi:hypothetical protein